MEAACHAGIVTADRDRIGSYFSLLLSQLERRDLSEAGLLDDALALCEASEQKRWYYAGLHVLKALVSLAKEDLDAAEAELAVAYNFQPALPERDFLFNWAVETLDRVRWTQHRPYLSHWQAIANANDAGVPAHGVEREYAADRPAGVDRPGSDIVGAVFRKDLLANAQPDLTLEAFGSLQ